jgi:hypothetical protein
VVKTELMTHVKRIMINKLIDGLKATGEGALTVRRRKAFYFAETGLVDHDGLHTVFGQVFQHEKKINYVDFNKNKVDKKVFTVTFPGEGA